jgi:hypothetical protein
VTRDEVAALFADNVPIGGSDLGVEITLADDGTTSISVDDQGNYRTTLRLFVYDDPVDGSRSIRDIKEQEIWAGRLGDQSPERFTAFLQGWDRAFRKLLDTGLQMDTFMPHDLCGFDAFGLKTVNTAEEFEQALMARKRLGRCLPRGVDLAAYSASVAAAGVTSPRDDDAL